MESMYDFIINQVEAEINNEPLQLRIDAPPVYPAGARDTIPAPQNYEIDYVLETTC